MTKQTTFASSFITTNRDIVLNNDVDDENDNVQINKQICTNYVLAIRNNEGKFINKIS
jgi:hypothetical protein